MALIEKVKGKLYSSYLFTTSCDTFLLDYPGELEHDGNIIIPSVSLDLVDAIFISNSQSLGVLFIDQYIPVYITRPVYLQILYKINLAKDKHLNSEWKHRLNLLNFEKNCKFIQFGEHTVFNKTTIICKSNGLYLGWGTFLIKMYDQSILYFTDISFINKVCLEIQSVKPDYVLWNKPDITNYVVRTSVGEFNKLIQAPGKVVMEVESPNMLIDILYHLNYLLKKTHKKIKLECEGLIEILNSLLVETDCINKKYGKLSDLLNDCKNSGEIIIRNNMFNSNINIIKNDTTSIFNINTCADEESISKFFECKILQIQPNVHYNLVEGKKYEEFYAEGCMNLTNDKVGYLFGQLVNTDFDNLFSRKMVINENQDFFTALFKIEPYIKKGSAFYFFRRHFTVTVEDGMYCIKKGHL